MNNILIKDFSNKLRPAVEVLSLEINKSQVDVKECLQKIKEIRNDITHLCNLLKIELVLQNEKST
jgi:hypothetical protein